MAKKNGPRFAIMRDLQDHAEHGRLGLDDLGAYYLVHAQADFEKGIWWGSAPKLHATAPKGKSLRDTQRILQHLNDIGFLKSFHRPGERGNYPVLINKYEPLIGAHKGQRLNATATDDWREPIWESCALSDALPDAVAAPIQYSVCSKQKKTPAAKPAAVPDSRFQSTIDAYYDCQKKAGVEPGCDKSDFASLKNWLKRNPSRTNESIAASLRNAIASTDHYPLRPGFRLREFLEHESKYQIGPLLKAAPKIVQRTAPKNELSPEGAAKVAAYMNLEAPAWNR